MTGTATAGKVVTGYFGNAAGASVLTGEFSFAASGGAGVAVNSTGAGGVPPGTIYVFDRQNSRVQRFTPTLLGATFERMWGGDVVASGPGQADERQSVAVNATAGQFRLSFGADTTSDLAFNASAGTVEAALNGLGAVSAGGGSVSVLGGAGGVGGHRPYVVTFDGGPLAGTDVDQLATASGTTPLSGGSGVTVATIEPGVTGPEICTAGSGALCKAGSSGTAYWQFANGAPQAPALSVDSAGDVYVGNGNPGRVQKFSPDGEFIEMLGKDVVSAGPGNADERQAVTVNANAGTFRLTFGASTTGDLAFDAPANGGVGPVASVQNALEALPSVGAGNVLVTRGPGGASGTTPYVVQFIGVLGGTDVAALTASNGGVPLSGGTGTGANMATVTVVRIGATGGERCVPASGDVCKAAVNGALGGDLAGLRTANAVDGDGNLYVTEINNRRIAKFDADGQIVGVWGWDVVASGPGNDTTAPVNEWEVCTPDHGDVCKAALTSGGGFGSASPDRVAVDGDGFVYAVDAPNGRVVRFDSDGGSPTDFARGQLSPADTVEPDGAPADGPVTDVAYDSSSGNLLFVKPPVAGEGREIKEISPAGALVDTHMVGSQIASVDGLAVDSVSGKLYVTSLTYNYPTNTVAHRVYVVDDAEAGAGATAEIDAPTDVGSDTATFSGTVNPMGFPPARYYFEYSPDGVNWTRAPAGAGSDIGEGFDDIEVAETVTGLDPNALYRVRLVVAKNYGGVGTTSAELTFATDAAAPGAQTLATSKRTPTSVLLRGKVDPNGTNTTYRFEYGPQGGSFDHHVPIPDANAGAANTPTLVSQPVAGLVPNTDYQYRIVATSTAGTTTGDTIAFATPPTQSAPADQAARAYELVSPADKVSGVGVGEWYHGIASMIPSGFGAYRGDRFAVQSNMGAQMQDGPMAFASDLAVSERTSDGEGWAVASLVSEAYPAQSVAAFINVVAASPDLSKVIVRGNIRTLMIFPEMLDWWPYPIGAEGPWATYVVDRDGKWEIFGPRSADQIRTVESTQGQSNQAWESVVSGDGRHVVASSNRMTQGPDVGLPAVSGLAGSSDPAHPGFDSDPSLVSGAVVYDGDFSGGVKHGSFDGGRHTNVGVCTPGTEIPEVDGDSGKLVAQGCPGPDAGRSQQLVSRYGATLQRHNPATIGLGTSLTNVVSRDGSRVFFMSPDPLVHGVAPPGVNECAGAGVATRCPAQLFVRQRDSDGNFVTRWISRAEEGLFGAQDATLVSEVLFEGASVDGDKVFFRTRSPLTADDPNAGGSTTTGAPSSSSWDLYMYDLPDDLDADPADGQLTRISAGPTGAGDCNVTAGTADAGALRFVSDDGKRAYFTCAALLPGVALAGNGTITDPSGTASTTATTNLYAYDATATGAQRWRFVANLPRSITDSAAACATTGMAQGTPLAAQGPTDARYTFAAGWSSCVRGAGDGRFVTFWTRGRLTADDPDSTSADVYAYDQRADDLVRITAPQGGVGGTYPCGNSGDAALVPCYGDGGLEAAGTPAGRVANQMLGVATDPLVAGDRVAFFQSRSRLVAEDTDDKYDVYQWRNGELSLVSVGTETDTIYKGNDRTGRNVYIATRDRLSWQDFDAVADVYVARVGGGIPEPAPPEVCGVLAGACQGGDATPVATDQTTGNPGGANQPRAVRASVSLAGPSARARRAAARTGRLRIAVGSNVSSQVTLVARARLGRRDRVVARASAHVAGKSRSVVLQLNRAARVRLRAGRPLTVRVQAQSAGARPKSVVVRLIGVGR